MLLLFFIHEASVIFFVALFLYAIRVKDKRLGIAAMAFLLAFIYLAKGIVIGGRPSGHFIDIFGLYATVFSPFVFLYFFYAMYRVLLQEKKTLLWYIAFTALAFSLLLSIRQKIHITDFAPYVMIAVLLMLQAYFHSLRVRLPMFQKVYKNAFRFVIATLLLNEVQNWAAYMGIRRLQLLADADNKIAFDFYDINNFSRTKLVCIRKYVEAI